MKEVRQVQVDRRLARGLRLKAHKENSTKLGIDASLRPRQLIIGLKQHVGSVGETLVSVGDRVVAGQKIVQPGAPPSAAIHAPHDGTVSAIRNWQLPTGMGPAIVIDIDAEDGEPTFSPPGYLDVSLLREAGIVGLGGAVFPTGDKVTYAEHCPTLLINGAECEPYISCDDMLMRERALSIARGSLCLLELCDATECIIGIESDKPEAFWAMSDALHELDDDRLSLAEIPTVYPAGGERQLIQVLTGLEVPAGRYPPELGYLCQNVATAAAVDDLVTSGAPMTHRVVTVTGEGVKQPRNLWVPIGTPIADLIAHCGGYTGDVARLIMGGSMMGLALPSDTIPITKATNCVVVETAEEVGDKTSERPCIRCGDCAYVCPASLLPQELYRHVINHNWEQLEDLHLSECIECGCCDVVCPSHILLTQHFRVAKRGAAQHKDEVKRAERAANRFSEHEIRLGKQQHAQQAEQEQLKAAARDPRNRAAELDAARQRAAAKRDEQPG